METVTKKRAGKKEVLASYRKRKTEFDKGEYRTRAEIHAEDTRSEWNTKRKMSRVSMKK
jgi:hypothetical protein